MLAGHSLHHPILLLGPLSKDLKDGVHFYVGYIRGPRMFLRSWPSQRSTFGIPVWRYASMMKACSGLIF